MTTNGATQPNQTICEICKGELHRRSDSGAWVHLYPETVPNHLAHVAKPVIQPNQTWLDEQLAGLSLEKRIAVKAQLMRAGLLDVPAKPPAPPSEEICGHCGGIIVNPHQRCSNGGWCSIEGQPEHVAPSAPVESNV